MALQTQATGPAAAAPGSRLLTGGGPVVRLTGRSVTVLGHPSPRGLLGELAAAADRAVVRVGAAWGPGWSQHVLVVVPTSAGELRDLVGDTRDLSRVAALATGSTAAATPGARDLIVINMPAFGRLSPLGRDVVLTHEVMHLASRAVTGPAAPTWLVEGLADYAGYLGTTLAPRAIASELGADIGEGVVPADLPAAADFDAANPRLAQSYEQAWFAVRLLASRYGRAAMLRLYRSVCTGQRLDDALSALGSSRAVFVRDWRASMLAALR